MMTVVHDSCGERSNNLDDHLAFDDEWLSVDASSTLDIDHEIFFNNHSSF